MDDFPRRLGPYVLLRPLARGGMGALYLAMSGERGMEKLCVIKTVLPHLADREYLRRFRDEAKVVVRLSHGNLVTVFDAGQIGGEIYLAMDFIEGKDLRATWNRCAQKGIAFPLDIAAYIVKELARGLGYAHGFAGLKLVHRDVSPPNVLLSYTGEVKLTDFGLASSTLKLEKTAPGVVYGKVSYMAPEQARGEALDGRTDLYAAGIMFWELLTGRQLFPVPAKGVDVPADELLGRVRDPHVEPPSRRAVRVPPELDRIALKALAADPAQRYGSGEELRADLASFLAKTAPSTDADRMTKFLRELFEPEMDSERGEREALMAAGVPLLGPPPAPSEVSSLAEVRNKRTSEQRPVALGVAATPSASASVAVPAPADGHPASGSLIGGRYRLRRLVGEGGMGCVYEAEHVDIGRCVALKILHPVYTRSPEVVERFRREARAASKISHPNVVEVTDSGTTDDGSFFFVMEFLEGRELADVIQRDGPLPVARVLAIIVQVCRALEAAHQAGVIHRDLKPENVLLVSRNGSDDFVKVLDFGIAKSVELEATAPEGRRLTHPGMTMGTPEYMAPEQAAGQPTDARTDIYAVGAILYEMLTGHPPYDGQNFMEILHKKANEAPLPIAQYRPDVSVEVEALVAGAMARDPEARPRSMAELELAVLAAAGRIGLGPAELAAGPGGDERATRSKRRRTWLGLAGGAAAAGLVAWMALARMLPAPSARKAPPAAASAPARATVPASVPASAGVGAQAATSLPPAAAPAVRVPTEAPRPVRRRNEAGPELRTAATSPQSLGERTQRRLAEGQRLLNNQQFSQARAEFNEVLESGQKRGPALVGLGRTAFQEGDNEGAAAFGKRAILAGGGVAAHLLLGDAYFKLRRYAEAAHEYEAALRLDPASFGARKNLALARRRMNRP